MREWGDGPRRDPGIHLAKKRIRSKHYLADRTMPICEQHGVSLVEITDADLPESYSAELRDSVELLVCPECFPSDEEFEEVDAGEVASQIAKHWETYRDHFTQYTHPDRETGPTFRFR